MSTTLSGVEILADVFNLNSLPLLISYVLPCRPRFLLISKKSDSFKCLIYFHAEIFSCVRVKIVWRGHSLGPRLGVSPCHALETGLLPGGQQRFTQSSCSGDRGTARSHTLMTCRKPCLVVSCLWTRQSRYLLGLPCKISQLEFSSGSIEC